MFACLLPGSAVKSDYRRSPNIKRGPAIDVDEINAYHVFGLLSMRSEVGRRLADSPPNLSGAESDRQPRLRNRSNLATEAEGPDGYRGDMVVLAIKTSEKFLDLFEGGSK
jgi:hypothetical protein